MYFLTRLYGEQIILLFKVMHGSLFIHLNKKEISESLPLDRLWDNLIWKNVYIIGL